MSSIRTAGIDSRMNVAGDRSAGFPPVAHADARILILGSLPGQRSIAAQQYYAHPQNAFWRIMAELTGGHGNYDERCVALTANRIALWDVLANSVRPGSLDADIQVATAEVNDFAAFLAEHRRIELICFNGQKAAKIFASRAQLGLGKSDAQVLNKMFNHKSGFIITGYNFWGEDVEGPAAGCSFGNGAQYGGKVESCFGSIE